MVTVAPSLRVPTTLLSKLALLRMLREEAVTFPVLARAVQQGMRHRRTRRIMKTFRFFVILLTCLQ